MIAPDLLHENIIRILGIESLSDERKIALLNKITDLVQQRIFVRILTLLPDDKKAELLLATEQKNEEAAGALLAEHVPNLAEMMEEEIVRVKQELKQLIPNEK